MLNRVSAIVASPAAGQSRRAALGILAAVSLSHLLHDILQSLIPAVYPILKTTYRLDFGQIGLITLTAKLTASLLQPLVGLYTDRSPKHYAMPTAKLFAQRGTTVYMTDGTRKNSTTRFARSASRQPVSREISPLGDIDKVYQTIREHKGKLTSSSPTPARMAFEQMAALPQAGARPRITKGK
jgi:hypothetical protein